VTVRLPWIRPALVLAAVVLVAVLAERIPWHETIAALAAPSWPLVAAAMLANVAAMAAKGWAWHLLLRTAAPHRLRSAQIATFVGAAVNCVSVSMGGEAARVHVLVQREGVPYGAAAAGVLASRVAEAVALAVFVCLVAAWLPRPDWAIAARWAALGVLVLGVIAWRVRLTARLAARLPVRVRTWLAPLATQPPAAAGAAIGLGLVNWLAEWAAFYFAVLAAGVHVPIAAALTGLLFANLGGIPRLTPGNLGVLQATTALALAPFGVPAGPALAAGVLVQATQILPMAALGGLAAAGTLGALFRRPPAGGPSERP
jgi:hypothetical protein